MRTQAVCDALAFRRARHTRYLDHVVSEYVVDVNEGRGSYTSTMFAASSKAAARDRTLAEGEQMESFVRTFAYKSGPAYASADPFPVQADRDS
jgi:hypothetical protein